MPIRVVPDKPSNNQSKRQQPKRRQTNRNSGSSGGLGGGLGAMIPGLIGMFGKNPKMLIIVAIIGAIVYFMGGGCESTGDDNLPVGPETDNNNQNITNPDDYVENNNNSNSLLDFFKGADLNEEVYDEADVFEPLADNSKNPLPEKYSLEKYAPTRLNQGGQGSCVGWASSYAARTILFARQSGENPNNVRFSPSYLYNQIALRGCQGSYVVRAMENMQQEGALPYVDFKYNENDCKKQPNGRQQQKASNFRITGFNRLTKGGSNYKTDLLAIKQHLSQGSPVVIGMMVGGSFMTAMNGQDSWRPTQSDMNQRGFGGHAMCVIGYDDYKFGSNQGGFQIMNSWGEEWGNKGLFWISYSNFDEFTREAYGLHPMGDANEVKTPLMKAVFGLVNNDTKQNIDFTSVGGNTFATSNPITKGTKFKIEVTNQKECYTYVIGEEIDGSSYVVFPYTEKHSPYCGITGTRLFPKDHSLQADDLGNKDRIAIIMSSQPIDYNVLNSDINSSNGQNFDQKISNALGKSQITTGRKQASKDGVYLEGDSRFGTATYAVLEIEKR